MKYSAQKFSQDTGISEKLASRILGLLYEKNLSAEDFSTLLWKLRDWFIQNQMPTLIEKLKDDEISGVIDQIMLERAMWQSQCPRDVCCAETESDLEMAFNALSRPETAWFFTTLNEDTDKVFKKGDVVRVQIMRTGTWQHQEYGEVKIDKKVIKEIVKNFNSGARGVDLAVDENHEPDHKALAWFKELIVENDGNDLYADVELTASGANLLNNGSYKYFSPEIVFHRIDEETGESQSNLLNGGAFTNRPFFKRMQPLMASEDATSAEQLGTARTTQGAYFFSHSSSMKKLIELMAKLADQTSISASDKTELEQVYSELPESDRSDDVNKTFAEILAKFDDAVTPPENETEEEKAARLAKEKEEKGEEEEEEEETEEEEVVEAPAEGAVPAVDGVQANEDGSYKITDPAKFAESIKGIQALASNLQRETSLAACEKSVAPLIFSEKRKDKVILPKQRKAIVEFAASLDEKKRATFFSILGEMKTVPASEIGHGKVVKKADVTKPETFSAEDTQVQFFMEKMAMDLPAAQKAAAHFYAEKAKRS